jgi:glutamate/tyrosine decarboxylase-like PLP-dependent enzyme
MAVKKNIRDQSVSQCSPEEIALKSYFLGPKAENAPWVEDIVTHIFRQWFDWRRSMYESDGRAISEADQNSELFRQHIKEFKSEIDELLMRFNSEVPSYSPRYIGHMISEVSMPALMGHILTLLYNPNNISGEVSRVGLEIEQNAIGALISMVGFDARQSTGHFTSGGTIANIESALRSRARVYRWIAAGAVGRKLGCYKGSIFEAAHMGWDVYDELIRAIRDVVSKENVEPIDPSKLNPFQQAQSTPTSQSPGLNSHQHESNSRTSEEKEYQSEIEIDRTLESYLKEYHLLSGNPFDVAHCISYVFEEVWRGPIMLVPGNKHYSWNKAAEILGLGEEAFWQVETDEQGKMDPKILLEMLDEAQVAGRPVMMVVSVAGTTELGEVDTIDEIQEIIDTYEQKHGIHIWHHVDAAYGGFFCTLKHDTTDRILEEPVRLALRAVGYVNSVTIDPHKLGFVPYASGAFLCADRREYKYTTVHAPYIDFREGSDVGVSTLEGSRSAAGAVSTWLTSRVIGFDRPGYGRILERTVLAARKIAMGLMEAHPWIRVNQAGDTNIVTFCVAKDGEQITVTNRRALEIFKKYASGDQSADDKYFVSKTTLSLESYRRLLDPYSMTWQAEWDTDELVLIRLVLLNPFLDTKESNIGYIEGFIKYLVGVIEGL